MLLCIDLSCHNFVEVHTVISAWTASSALGGGIVIQLGLHLLLEPHDHVEAIAVENLEDEHVRSLFVLVFDSDDTP